MSPAALALMASEAALEPILILKMSRIRRRRSSLIALLEQIEGVAVKTQGAFYCIAQLPIADAEDFSRFC